MRPSLAPSMTQSLAACASALDDAKFAALAALEAARAAGTMEAATRIASLWRGIESSGKLARAIAIETLPRPVEEGDQ